MNPVLTLTSDFGQKDPFLGILKAKLYSMLERPSIVDISHEIEPFNVAQAAFVVQHSYTHFPEGSVHVLCIDDTISPENKPIIAKLNKHYFVCADNGILSLISPKIKPDNVYEIYVKQVPNDNLNSLDVFVNAAAHLMRGGAPNVIGIKKDDIEISLPFKPSVGNDKNSIIGKVIYIDNY